MKVPSVIRLLEYRRIPHQSRALSRKNILLRDRYTCQYCGVQPGPEELTIDHVLPRSQGGLTTWDNVVTACRECNHRKGGRTPEEIALAIVAGVLLVAEDPAKVAVNNGQRCPANAPAKEYHVSAINVEITLSRFLDYFPGYMYVLNENVEKVRGEEAANKAARDKENDPGAVSNGLQGDAIQPLVIRANQGDCLKLTLHNGITDEATNLVINTDRRTYHLELRANPSVYMASVSWTYPQDELIALRQAQEAEARAAPVAQ